MPRAPMSCGSVLRLTTLSFRTCSIRQTVLCAAAGQGDAVGSAGLLAMTKQRFGNCHPDTCCDLIHRLAFADEGDDLGLCENGALCGDGDDVLSSQRARTLGQAQLEGTCHCLEEAASTGCALVVHGEVLDGAVGIDADTPLTSWPPISMIALTEGSGHVHAHCVAGDLEMFSSAKGTFAAVAGTDEVTEILESFRPALPQTSAIAATALCSELILRG